MNKLAIAAFICAIYFYVSPFFFVSGMPTLLVTLVEYGTFVTPLLAIVLGILANRQIKRTSEKGRVLATIAIVLGIVSFAQITIFILMLSLLFGV